MKSLSCFLVALCLILPACKQDPLPVIATTLLDVAKADTAFEATIESAYQGQIIDQATASNLMTVSYKIDAAVISIGNMTRNLSSLSPAQRKQILVVVNTLLPDIDAAIKQNIALAGSAHNQQMLQASLDIIKLSLIGAQAALQN